MRSSSSLVVVQKFFPPSNNQSFGRNNKNEPQQRQLFSADDGFEKTKLFLLSLPFWSSFWSRCFEMRSDTRRGATVNAPSVAARRVGGGANSRERAVSEDASEDASA